MLIDDISIPTSDTLFFSYKLTIFCILYYPKWLYLLFKSFYIFLCVSIEKKIKGRKNDEKMKSHRRRGSTSEIYVAFTSSERYRLRIGISLKNDEFTTS
jgi:hypothetical protein